MLCTAYIQYVHVCLKQAFITKKTLGDTMNKEISFIIYFQKEKFTFLLPTPQVSTQKNKKISLFHSSYPTFTKVWDRLKMAVTLFHFLLNFYFTYYYNYNNMYM